MNKKLVAALQQYGLTVTGNTAYGIVQGYETNVCLPKNGMETSVCKLYFSFYATEQVKQGVCAELARLGLTITYKPTIYGIAIEYPYVFCGTLVKNLPVLLENVPMILKQREIAGADTCPYDGNPLTDEKKRCLVDGYSVTLNPDCVNTINKQIEEENRAFANAPNNYMQGICGALIGGVVGAACTIALYYIGFVSSLSAIVAVLLGAFLYRKFGGKPNVMMIVIVSVVSLVFIGAAFFASYLIAAGAAVAEAELHMSAMDALLLLLEDQEFAGAFYSDLAMLFIFTIVGIIIIIIALARQIKRPKNIG